MTMRKFKFRLLNFSLVSGLDISSVNVDVTQKIKLSVYIQNNNYLPIEPFDK